MVLCRARRFFFGDGYSALVVILLAAAAAAAGGSRLGGAFTAATTGSAITDSSVLARSMISATVQLQQRESPVRQRAPAEGAPSYKGSIARRRHTLARGRGTHHLFLLSGLDCRMRTTSPGLHEFSSSCACGTGPEPGRRTAARQNRAMQSSRGGRCTAQGGAP